MADSKALAAAAIQAAFPTIFDGTAWIAPWEPTDTMIREVAAYFGLEDIQMTEPRLLATMEEADTCLHLFTTMRDAYLNAEQKD